MTGTRRGSCQCGAVRYRLTGPAGALYACHCARCRRFTGAAYAVQIFVAEDRLAATGETAAWRYAAPSGAAVEARFCRVCGTRLFHRTTRAPGQVAVAAGTLDGAPDLTGAVHIWVSARLPGVAIPEGAVAFPGEPDD